MTKYKIDKLDACCENEPNNIRNRFSGNLATFLEELRGKNTTD